MRSQLYGAQQELVAQNGSLLASRFRFDRAERRQMKSARRWLIPSLDAAAGTGVFLQSDGDGSEQSEDDEFFWQVGLEPE